MADQEIGALKVSLSLTEADFSRSMKDISAKMRAVNGEFKVAAAGVKGFDRSLEGLQADSRRLSSVLALQQERVRRLREEIKKAESAKTRDQLAIDKLTAKYNTSVATMKHMQSELSTVNRRIAEQSTVWGKMAAKQQDFVTRGEKISAVGRNMATSFGAGALAVGGGLAYATKTAMDFDAQMSKVGAISGANKDEFDRLRQSALDLGASTSLSASQVAQAQENLAAAGYNTNQIIAAMPGIINAATASGEDLALVSDTVSSAINSFGLAASDAGHVADVLAQAANDSAAGVEDMSYTFKYAAAPAHALGFSMEELSAATEIMANAGIRGEASGTSLRAALLRLVDPPKEAKAALKDLGVQVTDSHGKMRPFSNIIGQLNVKTADMTKAQKTAALSTIFGTEAVSGMLPVVEAGAGKMDKLTNALRHSDGASETAAKKMRDNLKGAIDELKGSFETAAITIGEDLAPTIRDLAGDVQGLTDWFNHLDPATQKSIVKMAVMTTGVLGAGTAFGAMTMAIGGGIRTFGQLGGGIGKLVLHLADLKKASGAAGAAGAVGELAGAATKSGGGLSVATKGAGLLGGALGLVTNPIGATVLGLGALGVGAYAVYHHFTKLQDTSTATADALGKQRDQLTPLISRYDALRAQSKLTTNEFGRFVDLQSRLKEASSAAEIRKLKDEAGKLQQKSGLSNDELSEMVTLNGKLVDVVPGATDKITDQGNRIAENTSKARAYNKALLEQEIRELEIKRNNAEGNEAKYKREINNLQTQLNVGLAHEHDLQAIANYLAENGVDATKKEFHSRRDINQLLANGGESLNRQLSTQMRQNDEDQKKINNDKKHLSDADRLNEKIANVYLKSVGITETGKKGISVLAGQIGKLEDQGHRLDRLHASGKITNQQYNQGKQEIQGQIDKLQGVGNKIKTNTHGAYDLNKELRKKVDKNVNTHTHTDGTYKGLGKTVNKRVNANTYTDRLYRDLGKPTTKQLIVAVKAQQLQGMFNRLNRGGWATGGTNIPKGIYSVAEAGREFVHDPKVGTYLVSRPSIVPLSAGSSVLKNSDTERLGRALGLRGFASGVGDYFDRVTQAVSNRYVPDVSQMPIVSQPRVTVNNDNSALLSAMQKQIDLLTRILYKDQNTYLDGRSVTNGISGILANNLRDAQYRRGVRE